MDQLDELDQLDNSHAGNKRSGNNFQFEINQDKIGTTTVDAHDNNLVSKNRQIHVLDFVTTIKNIYKLN